MPGARYPLPWSATDAESASLDARRFAGKPPLVRPVPARSPHRASASFARRIGWREPEFAQQCAQGDVHLHVGERRADTAVYAAAERNPREGLRDGADESVRVERRRVREALF